MSANEGSGVHFLCQPYTDRIQNVLIHLRSRMASELRPEKRLKLYQVRRVCVAFFPNLCTGGDFDTSLRFALPTLHSRATSTVAPVLLRSKISRKSLLFDVFSCSVQSCSEI